MVPESMQSKDTKLGILNGWLKAMARVNDKTDHGHEFFLCGIAKKDGSEMDLVEHFHNISEKITIQVIAEPKEYLSNLLMKWFYGFQKDNIFQSLYYLDDKNKNFSLTDAEWKKEWCDEFVQLLYEATNAEIVWNLLLGKTKGYYANMSDEIILESKDRYYHLHFSLMD